MKKRESIILYHGSKEIVAKPIYGFGKSTNDYGRGFYTTREMELAKEWACPKKVDGILNKYSLDISSMKILDLTEYSILHWISILVKYRIFDITTPDMKRRRDFLIKNYSIDVDKYDVIIGYRADDSYFSFARAFLLNEINVNQLAFAMNLGKFGEQVVLKSKKAFDKINIVGYEVVNSSEYYEKRMMRDIAARKEYTSILEIEDNESKKIDDIMKGMK